MCQAKVFMAKPAKSSGHNCSAQPNLRSSRGLGLLSGVEGTKASELYSTPICSPLHTHPFDALLEAVLVIVIRILEEQATADIPNNLWHVCNSVL